MSEIKVKYNEVFVYNKAQFEGCTALMALLGTDELFEEDVPAQVFPCMILHAIHKVNENHMGIGNTPAPNLSCPFEIVTSSKKSDGTTQTTAEIRELAYNIMDEAENFIRNNIHWGNSTKYLRAVPGSVTPSIVERGDYRTYHLLGELLLWVRIY